MKKTKKLVVLLALFTSVFAFSGCITQKAEQPVDQTSQEETQEASSAATAELMQEYSFTAEEDGQTAFDIFESNLDLEYTEYDFGVFVEGVNGINGDEENYWAFYLNDTYAEKGIKQTIVIKGDIVSLKYEEVISH